jgi:hypothetical protein
VTPVDGKPPVRVADTVVELPTVMGEVTAVVSEVMFVVLTVRLAQVPVNGLLLMSPL